MYVLESIAMYLCMYVCCVYVCVCVCMYVCVCVCRNGIAMCVKRHPPNQPTNVTRDLLPSNQCQKRPSPNEPTVRDLSSYVIIDVDIDTCNYLTLLTLLYLLRSVHRWTARNKPKP
jgi:hypothetical protein